MRHLKYVFVIYLFLSLTLGVSDLRVANGEQFGGAEAATRFGQVGSLQSSSPQSFSLQSTLHQSAPLHKPDNYFDSAGRNVVFVHFVSNDTTLIYDMTSQKAHYVTTIQFESDVKGFPVFDVVSEPERVALDGALVSQSEVTSPDAATNYRVIDRSIVAGLHTLIVEGELTTLVTFDTTTVRSAFWTTDLKERNYLEKYLPSNLEFDQFSLVLHVSVTGTSVRHEIFANGDIVENVDAVAIADGKTKSNVSTNANASTNGKAKQSFSQNVSGFNSFTVIYPSNYTTSSHFFHLVPTSEVQVLNTTFSSSSGSIVPLTIYKQISDTAVDLQAYSQTTLENMAELEKTYGIFAHKKMLVYATSARVGMEYSGAAMTMFSALHHEVAHSWFARCALPANGNAGWIDEAVTVWRDRGYLSRSTLAGSFPMANHGMYNRHTDTNAYTFGADFIEFLNGSFSDGLKPFLSSFFNLKKWQPYTTESFANDMSVFMGSHSSANALQLFQSYVYNSVPTAPSPGNARVDLDLDFIFNSPVLIPSENPMHPVVTESILRQLL